MTVYVIPCGAEKRPHAAAARELYVGQMFTNTLSAAMQRAANDGPPARVLILSARHGLIDPDTIVEPYDQRIDAQGAIDAETVAEQAAAFGIDWDADDNVYALLPRPYLRLLDDALRMRDVYVLDVYEAAAGIGEQRHINRAIAQ